MSSTQIAKEQGLLYEQMLYDSIIKHFPDFIVRKEKEVKSEYGGDISAIDIEVFKNLKTKDIKKRNIHIFIQAKWKDTPEPIKNMNHFIHCCNQIITMKQINPSDAYYIYATKIEVSKPSKEALNKVENGDNMHCDDMERNVYNITKKIADIFEKKIPNFISQTKLNELVESNSFNEMKKANLISLVVDLYKYSKTEANKLKHKELVEILESKNMKISKNITKIEEKKSENIKNIIIEYNEPTQRCIGEVKSKLLKQGSELYNYLIKLKTILRNNGFTHTDRMGLHTEVLNNNDESVDIFLERVKQLEGKVINVKEPSNYDIVGKTVSLMIGDLDGYNKDAKITIAYFDNNKENDALECILKNI